MALVRHAKRARRDLLDIWISIAKSDLAAAERTYDRIEVRITLLEGFPEAGPARPDITDTARALVEGPYLILYRLIPDGVEIVRVLHGARAITDTLFIEGLD